MNNIDLLKAVGEASGNDIQHAENLKTGQSGNKRPFFIGLAAAAAALALALLAAQGAEGRKEKLPLITNEETTAVPPSETVVLTTAEEGTKGQFVGSVSTQSLCMFSCQNPYLDDSEYKAVPLSLIKIEEGHQRQRLYMLNTLADSTNESRFISIRESLYAYKSQNGLKDQAEISYIVRVLETQPVDGRELWLIPVTYGGGITGVYWVRYDPSADTCDISHETAKPDEESWVRRFDMLGELAAGIKPSSVIYRGEQKTEGNPVILVLDGKQLVAVAGSKAFVLKEDPEKAAVQTMDLSALLPSGEQLRGVIWDLSSATVLHYEKIVLTEAQKEKYASVLYTYAADPYLEKHDTSGMTEEEASAYFEEVSLKQQKAAWAGSVLNTNASERHIRSDGKEPYPEGYAGCYITGDKLTVCLPENVPGAREWVEKIVPRYLHDILIYRIVEHSYQELEELKEEAVKAVLDAGINVYMYGTSDSMNRIVIGVDAKQIAALCELILEKGWEGSIMAESAGPNILQ